jgi:hypothetical protein
LKNIVATLLSLVPSIAMTFPSPNRICKTRIPFWIFSLGLGLKSFGLILNFGATAVPFLKLPETPERDGFEG